MRIHLNDKRAVCTICGEVYSDIVKDQGISDTRKWLSTQVRIYDFGKGVPTWEADSCRLGEVESCE